MTSSVCFNQGYASRFVGSAHSFAKCLVLWKTEKVLQLITTDAFVFGCFLTLKVNFETVYAKSKKDIDCNEMDDIKLIVELDVFSYFSI